MANYPCNLLPGIDPATLESEGMSEILRNLIWPAYTWASDASTYDLTLLSMMNAIARGTTTITSAFPFPDAGYRAGPRAPTHAPHPSCRSIRDRPRYPSSMRLPKAWAESLTAR